MKKLFSLFLGFMLITGFAYSANATFTDGLGINSADAGGLFTVDVDSALVTNGDATHFPTADAVFDFCETTQNYLPTSQASDQTEFYSKCISTPNALGTVATLIAPAYSYARTISTMTWACQGGTNVVFMVEQRTKAAFNSVGTDVFTGDVTSSTTTYSGGTFDDATIAANYALYLLPTSVSGDVDRLEIQFTITKD